MMARSLGMATVRVPRCARKIGVKAVGLRGRDLLLVAMVMGAGMETGFGAVATSFVCFHVCTIR